MSKKPTVADFFAGIGGIRLGFEQAGFDAVYSNEIDDFCGITYKENFGIDPKGDITKINAEELPDFDVFVGGFPCQAFSIAGRKLGFDDTRGTLFFDVARILKTKRPKAFLLENVKNLEGHEHGNTIKVILRALRAELDYNVSYAVLNAKDYGVPQNRERIYIVGFRKDVFDGMFPFPGPSKRSKLASILEKNVPLKYFISKKRLAGMKKHRARHEAMGHGFGYEVLDPEKTAKAIVVGGMGRERNLIKDCGSLRKHEGDAGFEAKNDECLRYLTPREYARLQGFPDSFKIPVSNAQAYKQFANSVAVPVIVAIAKEMRKELVSSKKQTD
ncbi:Modification methylase MthTI [Candidatus Norongarragalina meridionalis]|nr:Modification methylase MthTI [Candidatus Norongarragalina meridionalis]